MRYNLTKRTYPVNTNTYTILRVIIRLEIFTPASRIKPALPCGITKDIGKDIEEYEDEHSEARSIEIKGRKPHEALVANDIRQ